MVEFFKNGFDIFDFVVVFGSFLLEVIFEYAQVSIGDDGEAVAGYTKTLIVLRVLRIIRFVTF